MRIETTTRNLYKFDELSEEAQNKAIEAQSEFNAEIWGQDLDLEFFFDLAPKGFPNAKIFYSGFGSQGDGASFEADFDHSILLPLFIEEVGKYRVPIKLKTSKRAMRLALEREDVSFHIITNSYANRSNHEYTRTVDQYENVFNGQSMLADICNYEEWLETLRHHLSQDIYRDLEQDYNYSYDRARCVADIEVNDYEFTEDGEIA
jgi:hypothetical protein